MYRLKYLIILVIIFIPIFANAQGPDLNWFEVYGGTYIDGGSASVQTPDSGFIVVGYSYPTDTSEADIYLVKVDSHGVFEWDKLIGGEGDDWAESIYPCAEGGYIIAGASEPDSTRDDSDVLLCRLDEYGAVVWQYTYGGDYDECANSVIQTSDGGYAMTGWTQSFGAGHDDIYLLKTDGDGELLWSRTFGTQFYDKGFKVKETQDGGLITVAGLEYFGYYPVNAYLIKTDANGDTLWTSIIGGSAADACNALTLTDDGGFFIAGWTMSFGAEFHDIYLVRTDSLGQEIWHKNYGGAESDVARAAYALSDGGFLITGSTGSFGNGEDDVFLMKTDALGDSLWMVTFGGEADESAYDITESYDGGVVLTGYTRSFGQGSGDMLVLKYGGEQSSLSDGGVEIPELFDLKQNYPNPFNAYTSIEFSLDKPGMVSLAIYDIQGRKVNELVSGYFNSGFYSYTFDGSGLASGSYIYRLKSNGQSQSGMMVLLK